MKTILQMVQAAEAELGLPQSASVFGPGVTDPTGTQMGALANHILDELRRTHTWSAMHFEFNLIVNPATKTTGNMSAGALAITNIPTTAGLAADAWQVSGAGIPVAARIKSVDSLTQVTMTMENSNTSPVVATPLLFMQDTYAMPAAFDWFENQTMWDRTNRWRLLGPDSPQADQYHRSGIIATGPRRHFRVLGPLVNQFRIWPPPSEITVPLQLSFEFLTLNAVAVQGSATSFAQYFANDSDTPLLDDQAIIQGIKWMFWEAKGFGSYVTMQSRWLDYVERQIARDGAAPTLNLVKSVDPVLLQPANIQDGNWPGPTGPNSS